MANVITTLPVELTGNNGTYNYTRERDILEMSVQSPSKINLLPMDYVIENTTTNYTNGELTRKGKIFTFDFSNLSHINDGHLLQINLSNGVRFKKNIPYTLTYRIHKVSGTAIQDCGGWYIRYNDNTNLTIATETNASRNEGTHSYTFIITDDKTPRWLYFGSRAWIRPSEYSFSIEILSLVEGEISLERVNNTIFNKPVISVSNSTNILGEYELSRKMNRHIKQLERNITKEQDTFKLTWR